jgi:hypothetical protein
MIFVFTKMTSVQTQNDGWHGLKKKGMGMFLGLADVPLTRPLHSSAMSWRKVSHFFPGEVSPKSAMLSNPPEKLQRWNPGAWRQEATGLTTDPVTRNLPVLPGIPRLWPPGPSRVASCVASCFLQRSGVIHTEVGKKSLQSPLKLLGGSVVWMVAPVGFELISMLGNNTHKLLALNKFFQHPTAAAGSPTSGPL